MFGSWSNKHAAPLNGLRRLALPTPAAGCHPNALDTPGKLKAWLATLPNANALRSAQQLLTQAELLAHYPGALPRLRQMLQLFERQLRQVDSAVDELLRGEATEHSARQLAQLTPVHRDLVWALAQLHKRLINAALGSAAGPGAEALYAAMRMLARQLRLELSTGQPLDPDTWRDLIQLYQIAEFLGGAAVAVRDPMPLAPDVHSLFFGSLLFVLTDPLHLPSGTAWELYERALRAAALVELGQAQPCPSGLPLDMRGLQPPLALARQPELAGGPECRCLRLGRLLQQLQHAVDQDSAAATLWRSLQDLVETRGRRYPRFQRSARYQLFVGLAATHQRLSALAGQGAAAQGGGLQPGAAGPGAAAARPCLQLNQSIGGAAFVLEPGREPAPGIGQLVLLETASTTDPGRRVGFAARVRRRLQHADGRIEIGVEKLGGRLLPVTIRGHRGSGRALLRRDPDQGLEELYAPPDTFHEGVILELTGASGPQRVRLESAPELCRELERIEVRPVSD